MIKTGRAVFTKAARYTRNHFRAENKLHYDYYVTCVPISSIAGILSWISSRVQSTVRSDTMHFLNYSGPNAFAPQTLFSGGTPYVLRIFCVMSIFLAAYRWCWEVAAQIPSVIRRGTLATATIVQANRQFYSMFTRFRGPLLCRSMCVQHSAANESFAN